jgi:hypothetical protein
MTLPELKVGGGLNMKFGYDRMNFYVHRITDEYIYLGLPCWCVSDSERTTVAELEQGYYEPVYLGPTKKRWWWKFLPFRDLVCPYVQPAAADSQRTANEKG